MKEDLLNSMMKIKKTETFFPIHKIKEITPGKINTVLFSPIHNENINGLECYPQLSKAMHSYAWKEQTLTYKLIRKLREDPEIPTFFF